MSVWCNKEILLIFAFKIMILHNKCLHTEHFIITKFCQKADKFDFINLWPLKKLPQPVCCTMAEPKITDFDLEMHFYDQKLSNWQLFRGHSFMKSNLWDFRENFMMIKCYAWRHLLCKIIILNTKINMILYRIKQTPKTKIILKNVSKT